jgi:hypothetical protein
MTIALLPSAVKRFFTALPGTALQTVAELRKQSGTSTFVPVTRLGSSKDW